VRGERIAGRALSTIALVHERLSLDARIAVDADGRIDGFRLVPARAPADPDAALPEGIVERAVVVGARALPGTLSRPEGNAPLPAVVLVHGSGPHDRDQTIGPNRLFRDLAHGLNARGIAVLRYEKRTLAAPQGFGDGSAFTVDDETVDDAVAAVALLRRQPGIDPAAVHVLGHSLGAMMAPRIAERAEPLAGVIMLAAPGRPLHEVVPAQVAYLADLDGDRSAAEARALADTERAAVRVRDLGAQDPDGTLLLGLPAAYWRDLQGYDPLTVAAALPQPLLLLHGGRDYQVTDQDFERWQARFDGDPRVTLKRYPALNHLFMAGTGPAGPDEYFRPGSFDAEAVADIAGWIHAR
jgi:uncharacterized protein